MAGNTSLTPFGWGTTVGLVSGPVMPANPTRNGLVMYNPSAGGISIALCPALVNLGVLGVYPGFAVGVAVINGAGSITMQPGDKFIVDTLNCTTQWNAIGSAAGLALTILES